MARATLSHDCRYPVPSAPVGTGTSTVRRRRNFQNTCLIIINIIVVQVDFVLAVMRGLWKCSTGKINNNNIWY